MLCNLTLTTIFQTRYLHFTDLNRLRDLTSLPETIVHKWYEASESSLPDSRAQGHWWCYLSSLHEYDMQRTMTRVRVIMTKMEYLLLLGAHNYIFLLKNMRVEWGLKHCAYNVQELELDLILAEYIICIPHSTHVIMQSNKQ